jgi:uncharacterized protein YndB with AHSA1/START domain
MEKPKYVYVSYINSSPEKVFEALTNPEFTQQYWGGHKIESDWKQGSPVKFIKRDGKINVQGEVVRYDPPRVLCYTWKDCDNSDEDTFVTFEIEIAHGVTKLVTTHEGFPANSKLFPRISEGWPAVLSSLKTLLESGKPIPLTWKCG